MKFEVLILGSNSALPAHGRHPSSQVINYNDHLYLVDCGEGTQMRMSYFQVKRSRIQQIFISHLHGDHIFGLPGLLTSYILNGRTQALSVYGPEGLRRFIEVTLNLSAIQMPFELFIFEIDASQVQMIFSDDNLSVTTIPLNHRIPTCGYLFQEVRKVYHILPEAAEKFGVDYTFYETLKRGENVQLKNGVYINHKLLTRPPRPCRSFAYCSDTAYDPSIVVHLKNIDLLYHEATFSKEMGEQASKRYHSTTHEAAMIARSAEVKKLTIGHFSSRYVDVGFLEKEAREIFSESYLALEGQTFEI